MENGPQKPPQWTGFWVSRIRTGSSVECLPSKLQEIQSENLDQLVVALHTFVSRTNVGRGGPRLGQGPTCAAERVP